LDNKNTGYPHSGTGKFLFHDALENEDENEYKEVDHDHGFFKQYQVTVYAFPFIFGTTGNVILLIIIICNKDMRTVQIMYILNLAIRDIIF